jgi:2-oxoglutarate ferredoxin oxidoreductase subunit beta
MSQEVNLIGLSKNDYRGAQSTLCQGCGHNSIASQIIAVAYEMNIRPVDIVKFSGIGCSSKCPTYYLNHSFGFNGLHGRMPPVATGALFADTSLKGLGMSGDGDTASIGMGHFKHVCRRNPNMIYIVANNGVYGLTKGQFSATAEKGLSLKKQGVNPYMPIDICSEALIGGASFVARSFAGDPKQVKSLLKAAFSHRGLAVLDIISPCVTFNNDESSLHSYNWAKTHQAFLQDISYIMAREEIMIEGDFEPGSVKEVALHDGSTIILKKVARDYDPTNLIEAYRLLSEASDQNYLLTGLIYLNPDQPTIADEDKPLTRLPEERLRPKPETIRMINDLMA